MTGARFRTATPDDVVQMLDWAAAEGWNPGLEDAEAFFAADPAGFFVAEMEGRVVAAISVVNHSEQFSFLGLYLCTPEFRGRGIGFGLWQHGVAHAGTRTIGLDGVAAQEGNYAKSGFVLAGRTRRLAGHFESENVTLPLVGPDDLPPLALRDAAATGVTRDRFLRAWLAERPTRKTVMLRGEGAEVTGFATARRCREGAKIGPVIAPDAETALALARQAASALGETSVIIDVPDSAPAFGTLLRAHGFTEGFATARMYRGPAPGTDGTLHAVATLELG
ncbi:hypothetical protein SAMN05421759_11254 [Roseivivax lentus]|uniref:N-acetyltransferase domain-containing protein n=1 Tax=Roseivivax lentus TaxID=633194 RepID=A0A1N7P3F6_9RHOB|nr:GNAT family N-acetyltransferase [Roseivivax lentus]SIT05070.1 hypothetical protein SAMN05421759_11254 [Roseivivax lentus]